MKIFVDGGCKGYSNNGKWIAYDGYFSVVNKFGELLHYEKDIQDIYSANECEYLAIKWAIENIKERPLMISSDSKNAIRWAVKGSKRSRELNRLTLDLQNVKLVHESYNLADIWNAQNCSPKYIPAQYLNKIINGI